MDTRLKKFVAGTLAVITMAVSTINLVSYAEDFSEIVETEEISFSAQVAGQLEEKESAGLISAEDVTVSIEIAEQVEEMKNRNMISDEDMQEWGQLLAGNNDISVISDSNSEGYPLCDENDYAEDKISSTPHYIAIVNKKEISSGQDGNASSTKGFQTYLYLNTNVFKTTSFNNKNNYKSYSSLELSFPSASSSTTTGPCRKEQQWRIMATIPAFSACTRYKIPQEELAKVSSEKQLHRYASASYSSPSNVIENNGNCSLTKCIYSLGDLDRDGRITAEDSLLATKKYQGIIGNASNRSAVTATSLEELAFNLAGDVTGDGDFGLFDIRDINDYVLGNLQKFVEENRW